MACSTRHGVKPFIDFIEEHTGEHITQADWHDLREAAATAQGKKLSRATVDQWTAASALAQLAHTNMRHLQRDSATWHDALDKALASLEDVKVTQGTAETVAYLADKGIKEALTEVRDARTTAKVMLPELAAATGTFHHPIVDTYRSDMTVEGHCEEVSRDFTRHALSLGLQASTFSVAYDDIPDAHAVTVVTDAAGRRRIVDFTARQSDRSLPVPYVYEPVDGSGLYEGKWGALTQWTPEEERGGKAVQETAETSASEEPSHPFRAFAELSVPKSHSLKGVQRGYIYMTKETMNPSNPAAGQVLRPGEVAYVVEREGGKKKESRVFHSASAMDGWDVGAVAPVTADQTARSMGDYRIVGIISADGTTDGSVPDKPLPYGVFK